MHQPTRLLILGATHIGRGPEKEPAEALAGLVDRVVGWSPDALAIEALPGELIHAYVRLGGPWADLRVGGLPEAVACARAADALFEGDLWEARRVGADRSRALSERVVAWCAALEPYTALLLAREAQGIPDAVSLALRDVAAKGDERSRIAGGAAARLGLQRLYPFDDHSDGVAMADVEEAEHARFGRDLHAQVADHRFVHSQDVMAAVDEGDIWPALALRNSPSGVAESDLLESGFVLEHGSPSGLARKAHAGWRARNLLMAGRLRSVTGEHPGGRVLALVSHAHKGPLEAALGENQGDLEIADVSELDRPGSRSPGTTSSST